MVRRQKYPNGVRSIPEYAIWTSMKQRCQNPRCRTWKWYGGRGIKVCERWQAFENFYVDTGPRPSPRHELDRYPDNDGNYEPDNCRWTLHRGNNRNRRNNLTLTYDGRTLLLVEWAEKLGIPRETIHWRLCHGWSISKTLTTKSRPQRHYRRNTKRMRVLTVSGRKQTVAAWARTSGLSAGTILARLKLGWSPKLAVTAAPKSCYAQRPKHNLT